MKINFTDNEKTKDEIIYNNLIEYMNQKGMSQEEQIEYLKLKLLKERAEQLKNLEMGFITTLAFISTTIALTYKGGKYAELLAFIPAAIGMYGFFKYLKENPYNNDVANYSDIKEAEEKIKQAVKQKRKILS